MEKLDDYEQFFNNYKNYFSTTEEDVKSNLLDDKKQDEKKDDKKQDDKKYYCQLI